MKKRRRKKTWTWSFERMHPVLKGLILLLGLIATMGYMIVGSWMLYIVMTR